MQILKGELSNVKGILRAGSASVFIAPARCIRRWSRSTATASQSGRSDPIWISLLSKEGLGEQGIRSTSDMESIDVGEKLIYGVRGAPPEVREKAREKGLTLLADATCPFVTQQEEAEIELLNAGCHLVVLSSRTHHGIPRLAGDRASERQKKFLSSSARKKSIRFGSLVSSPSA